MNSSILPTGIFGGGCCYGDIASRGGANPQFQYPRTGPHRAASASSARQAGIRVIVAGRDTDGRTTNAVQGKLDARDALDRLLAETGLTVRSIDGGVAILGGVSEQHAEAEETVSDIQVTGTRIVRNGYDAPTPTTGAERGRDRPKAPENIADVLTLLPAVAAGNSSAQNTGTTSSGYTGVNSLNLRNLGSSRTLVLLDGRRACLPRPSTAPIVDINVIPNAFIKRVDIVDRWGLGRMGIGRRCRRRELRARQANSPVSKARSRVAPPPMATGRTTPCRLAPAPSSRAIAAMSC